MRFIVWPHMQNVVNLRIVHGARLANIDRRVDSETMLPVEKCAHAHMIAVFPAGWRPTRGRSVYKAACSWRRISIACLPIASEKSPICGEPSQTEWPVITNRSMRSLSYSSRSMSRQVAVKPASRTSADSSATANRAYREPTAVGANFFCNRYHQD